MGSGESKSTSTSKRITVRNEEPRIIQVSEDVIRRLGASRADEISVESPRTANTSSVNTTQTTQHKSPEQLPSASSQTYLRESSVTKAEVLAAETEFRQKLDKIEKMAVNKKANNCQDISAKVAECYSNHPTQILRCSETVKEFAQCANRVAWVSS